MESGDRRGWRVVLIGAATYENLHQLPAVNNNLRELRRVLTDPRMGGVPPECVTVLADADDPAEIFRVVDAVAQQAEETLLVYFAGHGLRDPYDYETLYLALRGAEDGNPYTAFDPALLLKLVRRSPAGNRVVILDCCFSGLAGHELMGSGRRDVLAGLTPSGSCLITATSGTEEAKAPAGEVYTYFTGALLEILRDGTGDRGKDSDGDEGGLTLAEVFARLVRHSEDHGRPRPQLYGRDTAQQLVLVRERRPEVEAQPFAVKGRHLRRWPWWVAVLLVGGMLVGGMLVGGGLSAAWAFGCLPAWAAAVGAAMCLLGLVLPILAALVGAKFKVVMDSAGITVHYRGVPELGHRWAGLSGIVITRQKDGRTAFSVRPSEPQPLFHREVLSELPRRDGELIRLLYVDELRCTPDVLLTQLARFMPDWLTEAEAVSAGDAVDIRPGREDVIVGWGVVVLVLSVAMIFVVADPGSPMAASFAWAGEVAAVGLFAVVTVLAWQWTRESAAVQIDRDGIGVSVRGRQISLPWSQVESVAVANCWPGRRLVERIGFLVVRLRSETARVQTGHLGPWRTRHGSVMLMPLGYHRERPAEDTLARFAGRRWRPLDHTVEAVRTASGSVVVPLRLRGPRAVLALLGAVGVCAGLAWLWPTHGLVVRLAGAVLAAVLLLLGLWWLLVGDPGELRLDNHELTGFVLGIKLVAIPREAVKRAEVLVGRRLRLRLETNMDVRKRWPLATTDLDVIDVVPVTGHLAATEEDLTRALQHCWPGC
ncbi:caspase family protein [Kitasatospora acidiphila]|uniref:Caspase family protein n=1 Tax=Kitasatospora acidiphila TaxID=2567942 RepID=A0A540VX67_9ACTN|nr:caspase family protein [Kitasatospora acidiphila]TQF01341.1 caspase family protein [Kitasatospora acidiphila]